MVSDPFDQSGFRCRLDWGRRGTSQAAARGDVVVIVDVMSFATTVATAAHFGAFVYPCAEDEDAAALAARVDGELAVRRTEVPERGRFSLSPLTFVDAPAGARIVLPIAERRDVRAARARGAVRLRRRHRECKRRRGRNQRHPR